MSASANSEMRADFPAFLAIKGSFRSSMYSSTAPYSLERFSFSALMISVSFIHIPRACDPSRLEKPCRGSRDFMPLPMQQDYIQPKPQSGEFLQNDSGVAHAPAIPRVRVIVGPRGQRKIRAFVPL